MDTADLTARLDSFFHLERYESDDFETIIPHSHDAGIAIEDYATPDFLRRFNGLMLNNSDRVERVFTIVFPSDQVLADVETRAAGRPALIFTHHPMDFETSGRGLLPIGEIWLRRLRIARISMYSAHAPLDCHDSISTSRSLARVAGVPADEICAPYLDGHAGVIGEIESVPFEEFVERVRAACGISRIDTKRVHGAVQRVAVVAGGAAYPNLMQEAVDSGWDTYLTGDFRIRHGGHWAEEHRPQFDAFVDAVPLNLIGASHYATEALVLRHEMISLFTQMGLPAQFVPQSDPWR